MRWWLLLCVFATSAAAQQDSSGDDAKALLLEVRRKLMLTVNRLPKYMCTETIDRSTFQPNANVTGRSCDDLASLRKKPEWSVSKYASDRLRLDVAVSGDSEMFSWAGKIRFEDRSLGDLVRGGATSTGAFASFLGAIFGTNAASFNYNGDVNQDGRALAEFGFRVPLEKSTHQIGNKLHSAIVAYDGTFLVDPKTFDLVRLTVRADQLPAELQACEELTTLDYGRVRLNNAEFVLPKDVRLHVIHSDGSELENRTVFSGCHEFRSESSLSFDTASEKEHGASQKTVSKALALPPGLPFRVALTYAVNPATAAAGDLIKAKLTDPIKEMEHGVLVPKGALVTGRIIQIERLYGPESESLRLVFKLETVEASGVPQPFDARLQSVVKRHTKSTRALVVRQDLGSFNQMFDPEDPRVGFLEFPGVTRDFVIKPGVEITGFTAVAK